MVAPRKKINGCSNKMKRKRKKSKKSSFANIFAHAIVDAMNFFLKRPNAFFLFLIIVAIPFIYAREIFGLK